MKKSQFKLILIIILILQSQSLLSATLDVGKCLERYATMSDAVKKVLSVSGKLMGERGLSPRGEDEWVARQERLGELLAEQGLTHSDFIRVVELFTELSLSEKVAPLGSSPRENLVDLSRLIQIPPEKVAPFYYVLREYFHTENPRALESSPELQSEYQRRLFVAYRRAYEYKLISDNITRLSVPEMRVLLQSRGHEVSESRIRALHVAFGLSRLERWRRPLTSEQRERVETASQSAGLRLTEGVTPLSIAIRLWEAGRSFEEISEVLNAINPHKEKVYGAGALRDIFHARGPEKKGREWEPREILELVNRYEDSTLQDIADELERTEPSVAGKAGREGLTQPHQTTTVMNFTNPYRGVLESAKEVKINGVIQPEGLRRYLQKLIEENPQSLDPHNLGEVANRLGMSPSHLRLWAARLGVVTPGMNMPRHLVGRQVPVRGRGEVETPRANSTSETDGFKAVSGGIERAHEAKLNEATKESGQSEFLEGEANKEVRDYVSKLIENPEGGEAYFSWAKKNPGKFTDLHKKLTSDSKWSEKYEKAYEGWLTKELTSLYEKVEEPLFTPKEINRATELKGRPWSETTSEDKALLIKSYVLQKGQLPKQKAPGAEGKLAQFLSGSTPKAGASEPRNNKEQYKDLFEWARANQEKFPGIKLLRSALSPETRQAKAETKTKNNQELVKYAKSVDLTPAQIEMLSEVERMRLAALTKGDEELSPDDKAILIKTYVLQKGQLPKHGAPGVEGKLAQFLNSSTPRAGASEPKDYKEQYKDLFEWAGTNQEKFPGIKLLHRALSPETSHAKAEAKTKNNQELVKYAKSVDLTPAQIEMLNEVEKMRLAALTKGDEELSPDDKAILIKTYVLQKGQLPKRKAPGAEGNLGQFLGSSIPKAGASEPKQNRKQYKDLFEWARANQEKFPGIKLLHIALSPETSQTKAEAKTQSNQELVEYAKNVDLTPEQSGMLSEVERERLVALTNGDEALNPDDKALLIKTYVLQKGKLPKHGAPGPEGNFASFLSGSKPKAGASEPKVYKEQYQDLFEWARANQEKFPGINLLHSALSPETIHAKAEAKTKINQELVEYAKNVSLTHEQSGMLSEGERMRLVALTKGDEELSPADKAILIKAYVLQKGQLPKNGVPGAEDKLAQFLSRSTPRAGASEPKTNKEQYQDLLKWARANQEKFPGIRMLHGALSPETRQAKTESKAKNNQELVKYAKSVNLTPAQSGMLSEVERMRLEALTKGDKELSPADKAILIKTFVLQKGQLPKRGAPGAEGNLGQFLGSSTPKAGASEPKTNKEQYQDLLKWAETYQNTSTAIRSLNDRLRAKQD